MELFEEQGAKKSGARPASAPLAERIRPTTLDDIIGQDHLLGKGGPLRTFVDQEEIPSIILWGPPGCGKTTVARVIAGGTHSDFYQLNAVSAGVQDVRKVIERAAANRRRGKKSLLFIDEIHRFNKAQQDALLHSVEDGVLTLIGATTENPSFEVISPLLSRCLVYVLKPLTDEELDRVLDRAIVADDVLKPWKVRLGKEERDMLKLLAAGDARVMLNGLESALRLTKPSADGQRVPTVKSITEAFQRRQPRYDKAGEEHYNIISAFIKCIRGSDPDAAVYWLARMLEGGEDPKFIARRMIILASEDIGNADPRALILATSCFTAVDYIGMPEGQLVLSQVATYLASAPKSNASMRAIASAMDDVRQTANDPVPIHLRNAPTRLMKDLDYGREYKYSHDYDNHFVEQQYLPDNLKDKIYYVPSANGEEKEIRERLNGQWKGKQR